MAGAGADSSDRHVVEQLSAYIEGDLNPRAEETVSGHLEGCGSCARAAQELRAIVAGARGLDRPEPPPTLWPAIEGALARGEAPLLAWRPFFIRGLAVGGFAGAALVVLVGVGIGLARRGSAPAPSVSVSAASASPAAALTGDPVLEEAEAELRTAAVVYERSIDKLRVLLEREQPRWSPDARARCAERLARLDEAIARSRDAARRTPGDSAGSESLFAAYRSKIDFLAAVVHRGGPALAGAGSPEAPPGFRGPRSR